MNLMLTLKSNSGDEIAYAGPHISEGPLPALFYFTLSVKESLSLDPFNQPVQFLARFPMRVFALTLPGHGPDLDPTKAIGLWAEEISKGHNLIGSFIEKVKRAVSHLEQEGLLLPDKVAVAGLSRGAFIAAHAAAEIPLFRILLGFAPLTELIFSRDFEQMQNNALAKSLSLEHLIERLTSCRVRFYIGNHDTLVGTARCFHFIHKLAQTAYHQKIRSPQVELIIGPSIGHQGHGTAPAVFQSGSKWIARQLGFLDE